MRHLRVVLRGQRSALAVGLAAHFLFFLLHSFVQDFWQKPRVMVAFWLVVGLQRYAAQVAASLAKSRLLA